MKAPIEVVRINTLRYNNGEWTNTKTLQYFIGNDPDPDASTWVKIMEGAYEQGAYATNHWLQLDAANPRAGQYLKLVMPDSFNPPDVGLAEIYVYGFQY